MNTETLKGKWKQSKGAIQKEWGKITNDELDQIQGDTVKLAGRVQEKYGLSKDEAEREVNGFLDKMKIS